MREIKFRAWHDPIDGAPNGFYEYMELKTYLSSCGVIDQMVGADTATWEQYTGLKDKNGKEIYEGDIVMSEEMVDRGDGDYDPLIGTVVFYDSAFQIYDGDQCNYYWFTEIDSEVIGNIHDK